MHVLLLVSALSPVTCEIHTATLYIGSYTQYGGRRGTVSCTTLQLTCLLTKNKRDDTEGGDWRAKNNTEHRYTEYKPTTNELTNVITSRIRPIAFIRHRKRCRRIGEWCNRASPPQPSKGTKGEGSVTPFGACTQAEWPRCRNLRKDKSGLHTHPRPRPL